ncbi:MAG TPA: ribosomal protein S18-alanine N-acetyltransferase [Anaerolineaceae bacterium]
MNVRIRPMTVADLDQVHRIDVISFTLPWSERSFRYELTNNPAARLWVAEVTEEPHQGLVVAMLVMWFIIDEVHIATIAVHPEWRQSGIGRRLLATALLAAQEEGAIKAFLEVRRSNTPAQEMYRRFGFEIAGVRPRYYKDNMEDALLLNLDELDEALLKRLAQ